MVAGWGAGVEPRTLLRFAEVTGWPVLADAISGLRVPGTVSTYDPLLRSPAFASSHRPDVVLRVGGPLSNRIAMQWLDPAVEQVVVDADGAWLDPQHVVSGRVEADPEVLLATLADATDVIVDADWVATWQSAEDTARATIDTLLDSWDEPFEGRIARDVVRGGPGGSVVRRCIEHAGARRRELRRATRRNTRVRQPGRERDRRVRVDGAGGRGCE